MIAKTVISYPLDFQKSLKKAGNLRHAFAITRGEFIVIFDADLCPRADFIQETLPYFYHDPNIAIVQTPQYFQIQKWQTWVRKGAAYIQELFYRLIQVNRDYFDGSICVGSNAMYRRKTLEPFGGTAAIDYSEDVHTGFNVTKNGQKVRYLPIVLAKGLCPDSLPGFFIQQYRWAMGSISLLSSRAFWKAPLTLMQRVCYLSGMLYYISTGIGIFLTPLPSMLLVWFAPQHVFWYNTFFSLPSFLMGFILIGLWSRAPFGIYGIRARAVSYYAHLFALVDKVRHRTVAWIPSGVAQNVSRFSTFRNVMFWWTSLNTIWLFTGAFYHMSQYSYYNCIPALFFASFNYIISMSVLKDQIE